MGTMFWNSIYSSFLKLTVERHFFLHPCDSVFINYCNITVISFEKHCPVVLNVKLYALTRFRTFY